MKHAAPQRGDRLALFIGPLLVASLLIVFSGWTGPGQPSACLDMLGVLADSLPSVIAWLLAAIGFGWPLRVLFLRIQTDAFPLQVGLGIAAMLWLDEVLGSMGVMRLGGRLGAYGLVVLGWILLGMQVRRGNLHLALRPPSWMVWTAAPAIAVLLVAATSAPSWLWATEFGGYDALSYHLQLPKEWLAAGRIVPFQHSVYSFLPGSFEAAYFHLACLKGDGIVSVYACQLLHAAATVLAAWVTGRAARRIAGELAGIAAFCLMIGTPWTIVVGSLGYNEMPVNLFLASGLLLLAQTSETSWRLAASIGLLAGAACTAKLTAAGMVAVPLGVLTLGRIPWRRWPAMGIVMLGGVAIACLPWWLRNAQAAGNPVFPFATKVFGMAHWNAEQFAAFGRGHSPSATLPQRLAALWNEFLRYGLGSPPSAGQPWQAQWLILPWLSAASLAVAGARRSTRRVALGLALIVSLQIAFWLAFTHLKSRFLLPCTVPMSIAAAMLVRAPEGAWQGWTRSVQLALTLVLVIWSLGPAMIFARERDGAPAAAIGQVRSLVGDAAVLPDPTALGDALPSVYLNRLLPPKSRILLIGDATPLYLRCDYDYQTTWDRGILSRIMRDHPDDAAAWVRSLADAGYTHVLIEPTMLRIWQDEGWNDPQITTSRISALAAAGLIPVKSFANGEMLYSLPGRAG